MNFLAHAVLSFHQPDILTGNMISDFVKGKKRFLFPKGIQAGIELHRRIDEFTDHHPATARAKEFFRPAYRLYSGALVDVVYDHFVANDSSLFPTESHLIIFCDEAYRMLDLNEQYLPPSFATMFAFMKQQNWLYHYRSFDGVKKGLTGLVKRAVYIHNAEPAYETFLQHYFEIENCYRQFFVELKAFSADELRNLQP